MGRKYHDLCFPRDKIVVLKLSIVLEQKLKFYHVEVVSSDRCCSVRLLLAVHHFVQLGINAEVKMGSQ